MEERMQIRLTVTAAVVSLLFMVSCSDSGSGSTDNSSDTGTDSASDDTATLPGGDSGSTGDSASSPGGDTVPGSTDSGQNGDTVGGSESDSDTTGNNPNDTTSTDTTVGDTGDTSVNSTDPADTSTQDTSFGDTGDTTGADTAGNDTNDTSVTPGDTTDTGSDWSDTTIVDTGVAPNDTDAACLPVMCGGAYYQCADCIDNDSDGLLDAADPDCLGACDNNEGGFNIDIPGSAPSGCTVECYFDADNGTGNDACDWDYTCDVAEQFVKSPNKYCTFDSDATTYCDELRTSQLETCNNICEPLVPNGCDCWGCCEIKGAYRYIGTPGCSLANLDACSTCTPVPSCQNECGECELCIGETTLPDYCLTAVDTDVTVDPDDTDTTNDPNDTDTTNDPNDTDTTNNPTDTEDTPVLLRCSDGRQPCGQPGDNPCSAGLYCLTGCCTPVILN